MALHSEGPAHLLPKCSLFLPQDISVTASQGGNVTLLSLTGEPAEHRAHSSGGMFKPIQQPLSTAVSAETSLEALARLAGDL